MQTINNKVTRYRVTLDFTVDATNCVSPKDWNWYQLLELNPHENVNEVYVENLGEYTTRRSN